MVTLLLLLAVAALIVVGFSQIVRRAQGQRTPPELRGDWWVEFEREFRNYVRATSGARAEVEDRRRQRRPSS